MSSNRPTPARRSDHYPTSKEGGNNNEIIHESNMDQDVLRQEELFRTLRLRHLGKLHFGAYTQILGYVLLIVPVLFLCTFIYAVYLSKMIPITGISMLDAIKEDHYFCYLIPLTVLPTTIVIYINWLAFSHFQQNWYFAVTVYLYILYMLVNYCIVFFL